MSSLLDLVKGKTSVQHTADALRKGGGRIIRKAAPYIGPKGGKWNDPQHKVPYNEKKHEVSATSQERYRDGRGGTKTEFLISDPHEPGGDKHHRYTGHGKTPTARRTHALQQHAARHGIERPVKHTDFDKKAASHGRKQSEKTRGSAAAGTHHVADRDGGFREVETHHDAGHYAVHDSTTTDKKKRDFSVTHKPSGLALGKFSSKRKAKQMADHMHAHAGDAGGDAKFGGKPSKADFGKMKEAYMKFGKALDDAPDLVKGYSDTDLQKNLAAVKKLVDSGKKVEDAIRAAYPDYSDDDVMAAVRAYGAKYTEKEHPQLVRSMPADNSLMGYSDEVMNFYSQG